jgi:hypothetical protein
MTARPELTPEVIEALLPAYRVLLRAASEKRAAAQSSPDAQKEAAGPAQPAAPSSLTSTATPPAVIRRA